jgi:hypothetical protein
MREQITIAPRFNGPSGSGNGGYVCGLLARGIEGASVATLRVPPPLNTPLTLKHENGGAALYDGETLVGEAKPATLDLAAPTAPTLADATAAAHRYVGLINHRYETCFVCGPIRPARDGLDLFTGAVEGRDMVACTWTPGADLADATGRVAPEFIHAALDCPSYWALPRAGGMAALLARLTLNIDGERPRAGETLIVAAWPLHAEGRKHFGGAALYTAAGALIARAEALWIEPKS